MPSDGSLSQLEIPVLENGQITNKTYDLASKPTVLMERLAVNSSYVSFTGLPTSGNYMIDFFIDDGANYTEIDTSTPGQVTLKYNAKAYVRNVYCKIEEA